MSGFDIQRALSPARGVGYVVLEGIPVPPSSNHQYATFVRHGKLMRVPSKEYVSYKKEFAVWCLKTDKLALAREIVGSWASFLECKAYIAFLPNRLLTKDARPKKLDVTNRNKMLHDLLCDALGIDDSLFSIATTEKVLASGDGPEEVTVIISPARLRTGDEAMSSISEFI